MEPIVRQAGYGGPPFAIEIIIINDGSERELLR